MGNRACAKRLPPRGVDEDDLALYPNVLLDGEPGNVANCRAYGNILMHDYDARHRQPSPDARIS